MVLKNLFSIKFFSPTVNAIGTADEGFFSAGGAFFKLFCFAKWAEFCARWEAFVAENTGAFRDPLLHDLLFVEDFSLNKIDQKESGDNGGKDHEIVPQRHQVKRLQGFEQISEKMVGDEVYHELDEFQNDGQGCNYKQVRSEERLDGFVFFDASGTPRIKDSEDGK